MLLLTGIVSAESAAVRARRLEEKFMAPCCWGEGLPRHNSEVAAQMKAEISRLVSEGKSDEEIVAHFVAKHGRRILREPGGAQGRVLQWVPGFMAAAGLIVVVLVLRRWRPHPA